MDRDFRVGERRVRPLLYEIEGPEGPVGVEIKSMAVLVALARHAGEVRTRNELLQAVWGDLFVSEEVLSHAVWDLRRALGDDARRPEFIQTVPRRGYRLIAPVSWLEPEPGTTPRYLRLEELGSGAMGVVWKATDTRLGRTVALKYLPAEWSRDPDAKRRFLREAKIAAALDHPNVCTLYEVEESEDGRLFLVLAYYAGETLQARLTRGPIPWAEAIDIALGVAHGLGAAHRAGIVHRDIKPSNVMLTPDLMSTPDRVPTPRPVAADQVKILDFGIARFADATQQTRDGSRAGTPAYKSPEQSLGETVDPRSDIWSLGVVLHEMLSGEKPFRGDYEQAVVHAILNREPAPLATPTPPVPEALEAILAKTLSKNVGKRYADVESVARDLEALRRPALRQPALRQPQPSDPRLSQPPSTSDDSEAETEDPATAPPIAGMRKRRNPRRRAIPVAAILVLLLAAALWLGSEPPPLRRILVLPPEVVAGDSESTDSGDSLDLVASGLVTASLGTLVSLEGIAPIDPSQTGGMTGTAVELALATAADEVLAATLEDRGALCRVTLRRVQGADGTVLWSHSFDARTHPDSSRLLADLVRLRLWEAFPEAAKRSQQSALEVRDIDYRQFLEIQLRHQQQRTADHDVDLVAALLTTSPRFLEGHLLGARILRSLMLDRRSPGDLERALRWIEVAETLAPTDPRPLVTRIRLELAANRLDQALAGLAKLAATHPGHLRLPELRATLFEQQGDLERARVERQASYELRPSWLALYRLAVLEYRAGRTDEARQYLEQLLKIAPHNRWGLSKLAELELTFGDLAASEVLYRRLVGLDRQRNYLTNLGVAQLLRGRFEDAAESYLQALALEPGHPLVLSNLAEVELAVGRDAAAFDHCRQALDRLAEVEAGLGLGPTDRMTRAVCLARLEEPRQAVAVAQDTLQQFPEDAEVAYQAAVVYALVGEHHSALVNAERARALGIQPRWFGVPAFDGLASHPDMSQLRFPLSE